MVSKLAGTATSNMFLLWTSAGADLEVVSYVMKMKHAAVCDVIRCKERD